MVSINERLRLEIESREHTGHLMLGEFQDLSRKQILVIKMIWQREGVGLEEIAKELDLSLSETEDLLARLVAKGYLKTFHAEGEIHYQINRAFVRERQISKSIWEILKKKVN